MRWDMTRARQERFALRQRPQILRTLSERDFDARQVMLLEATLRALRARGVRAVLYVAPAGPREWSDGRPRAVSQLAVQLGRATGAAVVDLSWALTRDDFLDTTAHYTEDANQRLSRELAPAVEEEHARGR
jgi:hypothetical protein